MGEEVNETESPRRRLVIVDDEPVILELLSSLFDESYDVVPCRSGQEALRAMESGGVDVLLTDKNLPDLGGLELLDHARRLQPDAQVLIITGYASLDTALEALQRGAFDYIVKPPKSIFDVRRKVDQAFEQQRMARENQRLLLDLQRKNAELETALAQIKRVQAELIQSEKLAGIGTLAAGIAHEISSPLFGVMGLAEAILDEADPAVVRDYAKEIVEYSKSIKEIVVQLSGYSRAAEREYLTTIDTSSIVADAVRLVTRSLGMSGEVVRVEVEPGLYFRARTSEVQQMIVNLVKNAIEAVREHRGPGEGHVWVSARRDADQVLLEVCDDGPGIPVESRGEVFDPFYTTKPPGKGTGLGLNIVYRLVTKYRGTITVDAAPQGGARFTMRFPVATDDS
jgi:C4-dicarboxylate-specific signal transduction histidine kinase